MKGFTDLKKHLDLFQKNREKALLPSPSNREEYAKVIGECFLPSAKRILSGQFIVTSNDGGRVVLRTIKPTAIELYYHEEDEAGFKDPIMYHTHYRKHPGQSMYFERRGIAYLPYFPIGALNPHSSGVDVTFENPEQKYRASFLIREYLISFDGGKALSIKNSTDIYDDMLISGIPLDGTDWIEWVDGKDFDSIEVVQDWRRNVPDYIEVTPGNWEKNSQAEGKDSFTIGGYRFVKCPFKWQFRVKK